MLLIVKYLLVSPLPLGHFFRSYGNWSSLKLDSDVAIEKKTDRTVVYQKPMVNEQFLFIYIFNEMIKFIINSWITRTKEFYLKFRCLHTVVAGMFKTWLHAWIQGTNSQEIMFSCIYIYIYSPTNYAIYIRTRLWCEKNSAIQIPFHSSSLYPIRTLLWSKN